ncbi:MAG: alpha/beta fold hydrolase [Acidimicrobiia bacterium]|nr:alpha/beta fold hydrolase [Acidimicrobiia bacterium]
MSTLAPPASPLAWSSCGGLQCATLTVPLDYSNPSGPTINLAVARRPALSPAHRIGSLLINPGGPGDSGVNDLPAELRILTPGLQDDFDIVSFDPRGVARSAPVSCEPPGAASPALANPLPDPVPATPQSTQALIDYSRQYAAACVRYTGLVLSYVDTESAARDMDRLRAALGDDRLTYIGHSYGTLLGAVYADLFPTHIRAMVLDSALDPAEPTDQATVDQAKAFDGVLHSFYGWCATTASCAWRPHGDPQADLLALIDRARQHPLPARGGRVAGPEEIYNGVLSRLYSTSRWSSLGSALAAAEAGDGGPIVALSDAFTNHGGPNGADANLAIDCLDNPTSTDTSSYAAAVQSAGAQAPFFGPPFAWSGLGCAVWPTPPRRTPHPITATGAPPILVVATTGDPATPYQWGQHLAAELQRGALVTRVGQDHVAYYYSACVRALDEAYLIGGTLPPAGTVCSS